MKDKLQKHSRAILVAVAVVVIHLIIGIAIKGCTKSSGSSEKLSASEEKSQGFLKRIFSGKKEKVSVVLY